MKRQHIVRSYGEDEEEWDTDELQTELEQHMHDGTVAHHVPPQVLKSNGVDVLLGGKKMQMRFKHTPTYLAP